MALARIKFDVIGDVEYSRAFETFGRESVFMRTPLERIGHELVQTIGEQFMSEGSFSLGTPWQPLSPAYAAWKEAHFPGRPLLVATGEMRREMLDEQAAVHVYADRMIYEPQGDRAQIAYYHQKGKGHNPARPMVALNTLTRRKIDRIIHEWLISNRRGPIGAGR